MKTVSSVYTLIMNKTYISIPQYTGTAEGTGKQRVFQCCILPEYSFMLFFLTSPKDIVATD